MPKFSSLMREPAQISTHWLFFFFPPSSSPRQSVFTSIQRRNVVTVTVDGKVCPFRRAPRWSASDGLADSDKTPSILWPHFMNVTWLQPRSANLKALSHMSSSGVVESNCCVTVSVNSNRRGKSGSRTLKAESDRQPNASRHMR